MACPASPSRGGAPVEHGQHHGREDGEAHGPEEHEPDLPVLVPEVVGVGLDLALPGGV